MKSKGVWMKYRSGSDSLGRCSFTLYWMTNYCPGHPEGEYARREVGQCFFADPTKHGFHSPEEVGWKGQ